VVAYPTCTYLTVTEAASQCPDGGGVVSKNYLKFRSICKAKFGHVNETLKILLLVCPVNTTLYYDTIRIILVKISFQNFPPKFNGFLNEVDAYKLANAN